MGYFCRHFPWGICRRGGFLMRDERGLCELCGQVWCGRRCMNDPHKSNGLLFHSDGRVKTLKERGLCGGGGGWAAACGGGCNENPTARCNENLPCNENL